jgi:ATP-dependent Clp protease ATP-binding subunit ClpC
MPQLTAEAKNFLLEQVYDPNYGSRPLVRIIQRHLEDPLAEEILAKRLTMGGKVYVDYDEEAKKLVFSPTPIAKPVRS